MSEYRICKTIEFEGWLQTLTPKHRKQVEKRLAKIEEEGYFGEVRAIRMGIYELKWKIGTRAYYVYVALTDLLFLWGGNKNGQTQDIQKAANVLERLRAKKS